MNEFLMWVIVYYVGYIGAMIIMYTDCRYRWVDGKSGGEDMTIAWLIGLSHISWGVVVIALCVAIGHQWEKGLFRNCNKWVNKVTGKIRKFFNTPIKQK